MFYPFPLCFAITNITPDASPTKTLARFGRLHPLSNKTNPIIDTGILFREPTRLNVVAVVAERNHKTEKEMPKETMPVRDATKMKAGL